jgi:peroxiredoxin
VAEKESEMSVDVGESAPRFGLKGVDGRVYSLDEALSSGPVLLVFFKTTCGTCDVAFHYVNRLSESYGEGWSVWALAQDPPGRAREYAERFGMKYPVLTDTPDYEVSKLYDPPATPTIYLLESDGRVAHTSHGFSKADINELSRLVAERLGREPLAVASVDDGQPDFKPG